MPENKDIWLIYPCFLKLNMTINSIYFSNIILTEIIENIII